LRLIRKHGLLKHKLRTTHGTVLAAFDPEVDALGVEHVPALLLAHAEGLSPKGVLADCAVVIPADVLCVDILGFGEVHAVHDKLGVEFVLDINLVGLRQIELLVVLVQVHCVL